ncbi:MAG TPA: creatininase family protein [Bryobacterales bacterium]|nr:creatininase family protein [Bryobacterales bacterium]
MKLFAEMNREQLRAEAGESLVVMPIGATEQHGPHLPAGTDVFAVEAVAREAAAQASAQIPVVVTPTLPFGSSHHHFVFGATMSLSTETYFRVLCELIESLITDGFTRIFLVNGHGGNHELAQLAARDMALRHPVRAAAGSYWTVAWRDLVAIDAHRGRRLPGHAGDFETSLMLSLRPELVPAGRPHRDGVFETDPGGFSPPYRAERHGFWRQIDGFTDSPDRGTAENGARFRAAVVAGLARALVEFYRAN